MARGSMVSQKTKTVGLTSSTALSPLLPQVQHCSAAAAQPGDIGPVRHRRQHCTPTCQHPVCLPTLLCCAVCRLAQVQHRSAAAGQPGDIGRVRHFEEFTPRSALLCWKDWALIWFNDSTGQAGGLVCDMLAASSASEEKACITDAWTVWVHVCHPPVFAQYCLRSFNNLSGSMH